MSTAAMQGRDRRWSWYAQATDAILFAVGVGILLLMAYRDNWSTLGLLASLTCAGVLGANRVTDILTGRWERKQENGV